MRIAETTGAARPANKSKDDWVMFQVLMISGEEESMLIVGDNKILSMKMFTSQPTLKNRHWVYIFEDQIYYCDITTPAFVPDIDSISSY